MASQQSICDLSFPSNIISESEPQKPHDHQNPSNNSGDKPSNDESTVLYTNGAVGVETDDAAGDTRIESAAMDVDDEGNTPNDAASGLHLPDVPPGASQMDTTINVLQKHINNEFVKIDAGINSTLSGQTMALTDKLVTLTSFRKGVCPSASDS